MGTTTAAPLSVKHCVVLEPKLKPPSIAPLRVKPATALEMSERLTFMTQRFGDLLDMFDQTKQQYPCHLALSALTPRMGEQNHHLLELRMGCNVIEQIEISEPMNAFLYEHVLDANGRVQTDQWHRHEEPLSLRERFNQRFEPVKTTPPIIDKGITCYPSGPVLQSVIKQINTDDPVITTTQVKAFKRLQSAFKHQLHMIQDSLMVLESPKALTTFKAKKSAELLIQVGVHTGFGVAGATVGGLIGTAIMPAIGTAAGGVIGGLVGMAVSFSGKFVYDRVSEAVNSHLNPNPHIKTHNSIRDIKAAEKGKLWWVGSTIKALFVKTPELTVATLLCEAMERAINVSVPFYNMTVAYHDYRKAVQGLSPEKIDKINVMLDRYEADIQGRIGPIIDYLTANKTPDNLRRLAKIIHRNEIMIQRLSDIRQRLSSTVADE